MHTANMTNTNTTGKPNEDKFRKLEGEAEKLRDNTIWLVLASAENNAQDTWEEKGRSDRFSEEYWGFAISSLESLLCFENPRIQKWFIRRGITF